MYITYLQGQSACEFASPLQFAVVRPKSSNSNNGQGYIILYQRTDVAHIRIYVQTYNIISMYVITYFTYPWCNTILLLYTYNNNNNNYNALHVFHVQNIVLSG